MKVKNSIMECTPYSDAPSYEDHPLYSVLIGAIQQAMFGKGERHGGADTPFMDQPWTHYYKMHGRGFLTGQAAKKLEEASSKRVGKAFIDEMNGAIVYAAMAVMMEEARIAAASTAVDPFRGDDADQ